VGRRSVGCSSSILVACPFRRWYQLRMNGALNNKAYLGREAVALLAPRCVSSPSLLSSSPENCLSSLVRRLPGAGALTHVDGVCILSLAHLTAA